MPSWGPTRMPLFFDKKQNVFGLKVIGFSLLFIAVLLVAIAFITPKGRTLVLVIAGLILSGAIIPWRPPGGVQCCITGCGSLTALQPAGVAT